MRHPSIAMSRRQVASSSASVPQTLQEIQSSKLDARLSDLNIREPRDGYGVVRTMRRANPSCAFVTPAATPGSSADVTLLTEAWARSLHSTVSIAPLYSED